MPFPSSARRRCPPYLRLFRDKQTWDDHEAPGEGEATSGEAAGGTVSGAQMEEEELCNHACLRCAEGHAAHVQRC